MTRSASLVLAATLVLALASCNRTSAVDRFEAVMPGWQIPLELDYLIGHFWPRDHPINFTGYASAALDSIIRLAEVPETEGEAVRHWKAAARVIARDRPFAFLWYLDDLLIVDRRVTDLRVDT